MKSGPQGGVDVLGESTGTGIVVGLEAKHYAAKTRLPLDQLKSKVLEAASKYPEMDCWVLASTRAISSGDVRELENAGAKEGVDVLILDWDAKSTTPPDLAVLCAMATSACSRLGASESVIRSLLWVREHSIFAEASSRLLSRLISPLVGYGAARAGMSSWLKTQMKEVDSARLAFDSHATLVRDAANRIARPKIQEPLHKWWLHSSTSPCAILGDEGCGKTWAALSWWLDASAIDEDFPLTVFLPAKNINNEDALSTVATALYRVFRTRDEKFWEKRLRRWTGLEARGTRLLLIVDGLNQNWLFNAWSNFVLMACGAERRGKVALMTTVRPSFFKEKLRSFSDLPTPPVKVDVGPFDDDELVAVLATYEIGLADLDKSLHPLLKVPRLCHLAVRRRSELEASGDITKERLVYEDWKSRHYSATLARDDVEFRTFLSRLARRYRDSAAACVITKRELLEELTLDGGDSPSRYEGVLSEVVDGRWLESTGQPNQYRVRADMLAYALGLSLVAELEQAETLEQARLLLDEVFDAYQGSDQSVKILRCASAFAMIEESVPPVAREALVSHWLEEQNFGRDDFETFWRCIGSNPECVLNVAHRAWFDGRSRHSQDEAFVKGFANAFKWGTVASACESYLTTWLETYWLDPFVGEFISEVVEDEHSRAREEATARRAREWTETTGGLRFGVNIKEVDAKGQAWGGYRALELLSWLPRATLLRPLTAWAITRAVMGCFRQQHSFEWVLRWNEDDHAVVEPLLVERAGALAEYGPMGRDAAEVLLQALATSKAEDVRLKLCVRPVARDDAEKIYVDLHPQPEIPGEVASDEYKFELNSQSAALDSSFLEDEKTLEPSEHHSLLLNLARWVPEKRVEFEVRRVDHCLSVISSPESSINACQAALNALRRLVLIITAQQVAHWKSIEKLARVDGEHWNESLQMGALLGEASEAQIAVLDHFAKTVSLDKFHPILTPLTSTGAVELRRRLEVAKNVEELSFWLDYLVQVNRECQYIELVGLETLFKHSEVKIRERVFNIARASNGPMLANALYASGWSYSLAKSDAEMLYGSLLLSKCSAASEGLVAERVHPQTLGLLADAYPGLDVYLSGFSERVRGELELLRTSTGRSFPHALFASSIGWEQMASKRGSELVRWLTPFQEPRSRRLVGGLHEEFPFFNAVTAVCSVDAALGSTLMAAVLEDGHDSVMYSEGLQVAAISLARGDTSRIEQLALKTANTDDRLFVLASTMSKTGQEDRLSRRIREDLAQPMAGHVARGITLAGFHQPSEEVDSLWAEIDHQVPPTGWLRGVVEKSKARYDSAVSCLHWFDCFTKAPVDHEAYMYYELLLQTIDSRFFSSSQWNRWRLEPAEKWSLSRRVHWDLRSPDVRHTLKKQRDALKTQFLCSDLPSVNQRPRRQ